MAHPKHYGSYQHMLLSRYADFMAKYFISVSTFIGFKNDSYSKISRVYDKTVHKANHGARETNMFLFG